MDKIKVMDKVINAVHAMKEKHASTNNWIKNKYLLLRNNLNFFLATSS